MGGYKGYKLYAVFHALYPSVGSTVQAKPYVFADNDGRSWL